MKYVYSTDEEFFFSDEYDSREAAMEACVHDLEPGARYCTAIVQVKDGGCYAPSAYHLIEHMQEAAYDEVGEVAEGWLCNVTKEQEADLEDRVSQAIKAWLFIHGKQPTFFGVTEVEWHTA